MPITLDKTFYENSPIELRELILRRALLGWHVSTFFGYSDYIAPTISREIYDLNWELRSERLEQGLNRKRRLGDLLKELKK